MENYAIATKDLETHENISLKDSMEENIFLLCWILIDYFMFEKA